MKLNYKILVELLTYILCGTPFSEPQFCFILHRIRSYYNIGNTLLLCGVPIYNSRYQLYYIKYIFCIILYYISQA